MKDPYSARTITDELSASECQLASNLYQVHMQRESVRDVFR
jgi:hypothetical protein